MSPNASTPGQAVSLLEGLAASWETSRPEMTGWLLVRIQPVSLPLWASATRADPVTSKQFLLLWSFSGWSRLFGAPRLSARSLELLQCINFTKFVGGSGWDAEGHGPGGWMGVRLSGLGWLPLFFSLLPLAPRALPGLQEPGWGSGAGPGARHRVEVAGGGWGEGRARRGCPGGAWTEALLRQGLGARGQEATSLLFQVSRCQTILEGSTANGPRGLYTGLAPPFTRTRSPRIPSPPLLKPRAQRPSCTCS